MEEAQMKEEFKTETNETQMEEKETEDTQLEEKDSYLQTEVAPALIALHPFDQSIAVTVGSELRIFNLVKNCAVSLADESKEMLHRDSIRALRFSDSGKLLVSAGDDKLVKIWGAESWQCLCTVNSEKRVSAVAISKDEQYVCFADKFGVVWIVDLVGLAENQPNPDKNAVAIFGHYCSIITSLEFSPDGRFIVSADRDFKIRVSVFPKYPLKGVHEIQSFCLGHSEFVSCLTFVHNSDFPQGFLVSGSGDSTVCMWDVTSGSLLCTSDVGREANLSEESHPAVTDLYATADGSLVAVAIQSLQGILLLSCDLSAKRLSMLKVVPVPGETFIPTRLGTKLSGNLLWMVTGASNLPGTKESSFARIRAVSCFKKKSNDSDLEPRVLEDTEVPGGDQLLEKLQGSVSVESTVFSAAADALNAAMSSLLRKKQYSDEKRDFRKKTRNDKKFKQ
ncbi:tRNA (guanine-N(7)-)-methyltransferase non-catalytic subunit wdr4-like [Chenopodium quinoa]|uniref:tRNA (guanine-N(7)-)-methyltransferase non-catalytic subunit wdr4-like n=1 Tax=Chenopodium quinoa TaxID=63459 RepID=UPI000B76F421|nr:tRNA (guanine-N(7)-)-methyltransferase non-catalytic subunit wdr4-like [Chenopodium quinoa]